MTQTVAPHTEHFTPVSTLIEQAKARKAAMPAVRQTPDLLDPALRPTSTPTVRPEVLAALGIAETPAPKPALHVGSRVRVPALGISGKLVAVQPPSVEGGVTRYRIGWLEAALGGAYREAGFWLEDFEVVESKTAS